MKADLFIQTEGTLGEGPMWHAERSSIWWVDIEAGKFFECDIATKKINNWQVPQRLSLMVQPAGDNNTLLLAVQDGLLRFDIDKNEFQRVLFIEDKLINNRTNDGACDAFGRLWLGTMHLDCKEGSGKLYCIDKDLQVQPKIDHTSISNGICWSLQNDRMYYIDSATYKVQSYFFDVQKAEIVFEKTIITIPNELGMPDGMAIDAEGMLWIAQWGGFGVNRWNPENGELLDKITLPVPNVTSCAFGGEHLNQLFITTARAGLSKKELHKYPDSGSLFVAAPKVKGVITTKCKL